MNRHQELTLLASRLHAANEAQAWGALSAANHQIEQALPRLAESRDWSSAELEAFRALHTAHQRVLADCRNEVTQLQQQLATMQANKEGWMAYALGHSLEGDQP